jgi:ABC-2 type transport system permease protein
MRHALLIAARDLRERSRDRTVYLFTIVLPLALAAIFTLTLGNLGGDAEVFRYAVADADRGVVARSFTDDVLQGAQNSGAIEIREVPTADEARRLVDSGAVAAAFILPPGLTTDVQAGLSASIEVYADADAPMGAQVAQSIARSFTDRLASIRVAVAATVRSGVTTDPAQLAALAASTPQEPAVVDDTTARRQLDPATYYAAGMAIFFLFFAVQFGVTGLLDERRAGTLVRLLAAPVRRSSILAGKLLTSVVIGLVSMTVLIVATTLFLGARWGHPVGVALLVLSGVLAATGVMAVVAALARTA